MNKVKCLNERSCYVLADVIIFVYEVPCIFWRYINVDEVSLITLKKLLQSAMELLQIAMDSCYKLRQLFYYKVRHGLLQIATGITKCDGFITNCERYYKVRWLLQIATVHPTVLFQSVKEIAVPRAVVMKYNCCQVSIKTIIIRGILIEPEQLRFNPFPGLYPHFHTQPF